MSPANNIHISSHPCVRGKLSLLRSASTNARDTQNLVHDIATIVGVEALANGLGVSDGNTVSSPSRLPPSREYLSHSQHRPNHPVVAAKERGTQFPTAITTSPD
jgi:uracil phosphoribosyltransferase